MDVPPNFSFYGMRKTLPEGNYTGKIIDFSFKELTAKSSGKPYTALSARVEIDGQTYFVNLSLDPGEKGKATNNLILQLALQTGKTEKELIEMCAVPQDFFNCAKDKVIKLVSTAKGYLDVWGGLAPGQIEGAVSANPSQVIDPDSIPF